MVTTNAEVEVEPTPTPVLAATAVNSNYTLYLSLLITGVAITMFNLLFKYLDSKYKEDGMGGPAVGEDEAGSEDSFSLEENLAN